MARIAKCNVLGMEPDAVHALCALRVALHLDQRPLACTVPPLSLELSSRPGQGWAALLRDWHLIRHRGYCFVGFNTA